MYQGLYDSQQSNKFKTILLILLFPLLLAGVLFVVFWFMDKDIELAKEATLWALQYLIPVVMIWCVISFLFERTLLFSYSGATAVTREQEPEIYNIVENLCISRGLPTPKIGIIETSSMNAFALGWKPSDSRVVFTRGILEHLDKSEIEAVAAHELTHIINKDSLLMLVTIVYIGAISMIGEILIRTGRGNSNSKGKNVLPLIGLALILLGYVCYPLVRLAISRKREFLADAGSVELTKNNQAMISALEKISRNPAVSLENERMAALFIANPLESLSGLFQTHPSIEERIKALQHY